MYIVALGHYNVMVVNEMGKRESHGSVGLG